MKTEICQVPEMKDDEVTQGGLDEVCLTISDEDEVLEDTKPDLEYTLSHTWDMVNGNWPMRNLTKIK